MNAPVTFLRLVHEQRATDGVRKYLFELPDEARIEAVLIPGRQRTTLCLSSQVGCAVGCTFCATARMGLSRNLTAREIVAQYRTCAELAAASVDGLPRPIENIVYMGMGEPFLNYDAVCASLHELIEKHGFHSKIITVSTIGISHRIVPFGRLFPHVRLAVSLHQPFDEARSALVPLNRHHPLDEILAACREYNATVGKRLFFEYVLIDGENCSERHAEALGRRLAGLDATVNLIPIHPGGKGGNQPPDRATSDAFRAALKNVFSGHVTFRRSRGLGIDAACGQLAVTASTLPHPPSPPP